MRRTTFIEMIAAEAGVTRVHAKKVIDALPTVIKEICADGGRVRLPELGTFVRRDVKAKTYKNQFTGETKSHPAWWKISIVAGVKNPVEDEL